MNLLLDSHAFLWWLLNDERLPVPVGDLIDDPTTHVTVSTATLWELTIKVGIGHLRLVDEPESLFSGAIEAANFRTLAVHPRHVFALPELPEIHPDPFDRMLVAQAFVDDLDLVTGDHEMRAYPVRTVW